MILISDVIFSLRDNWEYMGETIRDKTRIKNTSEVFTPTALARKILDSNVSQDHLDDNFLDPCCGDGQILSEILISKLLRLGKSEISDDEFKATLSTVYGVDLMIDNVDLCRERLLCGSKDPKHIAIVEQNIYQADGLKFSYKFKPMSETRKRREEKLRNQVQKAQEKARKLELFNCLFNEEKSKKKITKAINVTELSPATMP